MALDFGFALDDGFHGALSHPEWAGTRPSAAQPPRPGNAAQPPPPGNAAQVPLRPGNTAELRPRPGSTAQVPHVPHQRTARPATESYGHPGASIAFGDPVLVRGFEITTVIRQGASGGAYRGVELATCRTVFVKESRGCGNRLHEEYELLRRLHEREPGLAPEPLAHFAEGGNEYLVAGLAGGRPLAAWAAGRSPMTSAAGGISGYYEQCRDVLAEVSAAVARLSRHGYVPGEIDPADVLVTERGAARLTGLGGSTRSPGTERAPDDRFGLAAVARCLLWPHSRAADWAPAAGLASVRAALDHAAPIPDGLWALATASLPAGAVR